MEDLRQLYRLGELKDYKVASHYPDINGWKIVDADNSTIGVVDDLLVNKAEERVVYIDAAADRKLIDDRDVQTTHNHLNDEDHLLIPIGAVSVDKDNKLVICNDISYSTFRRAGRFRKGHHINREYETALMNLYYPDENQDAFTHNGRDTFYSRSHFDRRG